MENRQHQDISEIGYLNNRQTDDGTKITHSWYKVNYSNGGSSIMATLNATNLKHASSGSNNIVLAADGSTTISKSGGW